MTATKILKLKRFLKCGTLKEIPYLKKEKSSIDLSEEHQFIPLSRIDNCQVQRDLSVSNRGIKAILRLTYDITNTIYSLIRETTDSTEYECFSLNRDNYFILYNRIMPQKLIPVFPVPKSSTSRRSSLGSGVIQSLYPPPPPPPPLPPPSFQRLLRGGGSFQRSLRGSELSLQRPPPLGGGSFQRLPPPDRAPPPPPPAPPPPPLFHASLYTRINYISLSNR
ncbi:hypothetical protein J437_LFUL012374 [Ladona fulva]|uniref:Uncharacterized protein n=1 Tax=Ladona fulva TaxID=123851 RepID=A0A8K0KCM2_LADFU|nr:hypothetical protein J437_LFUL012374 [Ladona fulva]